MALVEAFRKIAIEYSQARREQYTSHPLANYIRTTAPEMLNVSSAISGQGLIVKGSAGAGNFATIAWIAIFDPVVTTNARTEYYVVYLFSTTGELYLSLNQGTTAVRQEFGTTVRDVLNERAAPIRAGLSDFQKPLPVKKISLGSTHTLPRDYEAGHALGIRYDSGLKISEDEFSHDLHVAIAAYRALTFRGGLDPSVEIGSTYEIETGFPRSLEETRRYRLHRRIERNQKAAANAKLFHGLKCQVCNFDFAQKYGELGTGYIEAHHLRPLSTLSENVPVLLDVKSDFAVLCSNCHRILHRTNDPSDLNCLREILKRSL